MEQDSIGMEDESGDGAGVDDKTYGNLSEDEIETIARREIAVAIEHYETNVQPDALTAFEYINGTMKDLVAPKGRSTFVSKDVSDAISFIMPGVMRVFAGAGDVVRCDPRTDQDEQSAAQRTAKLNYEWKTRLNGYEVVWSSVWDALAFRTGIIKTWWERDEEYEAGCASGLTQEQLAIVGQDEMVTINEIEENLIEGMPFYNIEFKRLKSRGRLRVEAVPREEFLISPEARSIETARFVGHRRMVTRGDLIEMGFDKDEVDEIPGMSTGQLDQLALERLGPNNTFSPEVTTRENELVEYIEAYIKIDLDGDGIAERVKVCMGGANGAYDLLADPEEVEDDPPFSRVRAIPRPHSFDGDSIADALMDIQKAKTALARAAFDNIYATVNPQKEVVSSNIIDPDEVFSQAIGQVVRVKAAGSVTPLVVPFVGDSALAMMGLMDQVTQSRTGVSKEAPALDGDALKPETAMAAMIRQDAGYAKIELIARNIAFGLRDVFVKMLKIITAHQDWQEMIRLRGQAVLVDPRSWTAECDVVVEVGLGTGSRERDLAMLMAVGQEQDKIVAALGADNPIVPPSKYVKARQKMVEVAGGNSPEQYFATVPDEVISKQLADQQQAAQAAQDAPLQNVLAVEKMKAETTLQTNAAKAEIEQQKANQSAELERIRIESAERMKQMELDHQRQIEQMKLANQVFIEEMRAKTKLIEAEAGHDAARQSAVDAEFGKLMPSDQNGLSDHPMLAFMRDVSATHAMSMQKLEATIAAMNGAMAQMSAPKQVKLPSGQVVTLETITRQ